MIDLAHLQSISTTKTFKQSQEIIKEDDFSSSMFILLKGKVGVYKNESKFQGPLAVPKNVLVAELEPGDFFGEMSLFLSEPRKATVIAHEDVVVLEINQANSYEIIEKYPEVPYTIIKSLCLRISRLNKKLAR